MLGIKIVLLVKRLLTAAIMIMISAGVNAQAPKSKTIKILSLSSGISLPVGDFGKTGLDSKSAGYARPGPLLRISFTEQFTSKFGLIANIQYQVNALDVDALQKDFSQAKFAYGVWAVPTPQTPVPIQYATYSNWKFESDKWTTFSIMGGAYLHFPISDKVSFNTKALLGPSIVTLPELNGKASTDTSTAQVKQTGGDAVAFSYLINGGIEWDINGKLYFITDIGYFGTNNMKLDNITATTTTTKGPPGNPTSVSHSEAKGFAKQTIGAVNIAFGIGLKL